MAEHVENCPICKRYHNDPAAKRGRERADEIRRRVRSEEKPNAS